MLKESLPEQKLVEARKDIKKHRYEKATETLMELRSVTAGTHLGGEVLFLLGETAFHRGKYPEAESYFAAYLNTYNGGPFSEQSVYMQAESKIKQIQKRKIGFLSLKTYIPHDRDISVLREARVLFDIYKELYPTGKWIETATQQSEELLIKEGKHELEIAAFYLRKKSPRSTIARARRILEGDFPEDINTKARELIREAEQSLPSDS